jgi:hypothetical protein
MRRCTSARPRPARPRPAPSCARCKWAWLPQQKTAQEAGHGKHTPPPQLRSRGRTPAREGAASDPGQKRLLLQLNGRRGRGLGARLRCSSARGTPSTRTHGRSRTLEAQGTGHRTLWVRARAVRPAPAPGWQRCDRLVCCQEHGVPQGLRHKGRVRVRMWNISNDAHSLAGDGHIPRQRPAPDSRQTFAVAHLGPGPRGPETEHTCRRSTQPTAQAPDGARSATRWTAGGPRISTPPAPPGRESRALETARRPPRQDIPRGHRSAQAPSHTGNTPQP